MFTPIIQLLRKKSKLKILFFLLCISLLSAYPIYKNFYNGAAVRTYERHIALIEGRSDFYNPWQYRMLSPAVIEGLLFIYNHSIDKVYPVEEKLDFKFKQTSEPTAETKEFLTLLQTKGVVKYMIVFLFFRFLLTFCVFILAFCIWHYFIKNNWLILMGLMLLSLAMGNAVIASDLTFNTYLDNLFYLLAAGIILYKRNPCWLIPLVLFAALNRETAMLIPFLYFISAFDFSAFNIRQLNFSSIKFPKTNVWVLTLILYAIFISVFICVRAYYGYVSPQVWKVPAGIEMIKLNLLSLVAVKSCFEMLGVFSVIPLLIIFKFRSFPLQLKVWFCGIVPVWFAVHIYSVVIYQTRLFLVPVIIVFIPMLLWLIENKDKIKSQSVYKSLKQ